MPKPPRSTPATLAAAASLGLGMTVGVLMLRAQQSPASDIHSMDVQPPPVVTPATNPEQPTPPPSDALVLFGGKPEDLANFASAGTPEDLATWKVENGILVAGKKYIRTKDGF